MGSYLSQQAFWTLLLASLEQTDSPILRSFVSCPVEALCTVVMDQISALASANAAAVSAAQLQSILSAAFLGLQQFTLTYNSLLARLANEVAAPTERISKGFHAMLELYHKVDTMMATQPVQKAAVERKGNAGRSLQQALRPILRDIAQSILVCYFVRPSEHGSNPSNEQH